VSPNLTIKNIRLRLSIGAIFLLMITPIFILFILYSYQTNYEIYRKNAVDLIIRANEDSVRNLITFIDPIADSVRTTSKLVALNPDLMNQEKVMEHLALSLENNPDLISYFLSSGEGSFRQVQRTNKSVPIGNRLPPDKAQYVSWVVNRNKNTPPKSTYTFFRSYGEIIETFSEPTSYDPRSRKFYTGTAKNFADGKVDAPNIEDPFFTTSTKEAAIGISHPVVVNQQLFGVTTALVKLQILTNFLEKNKISTNSKTIIFNDDGDVIAHPDINVGFTKIDNGLALTKLLKLENSPIPTAFEMHQNNKTNRVEFTFGEKSEPYIAIFSPFPTDFSKPWHVVTIAPLNDFMSPLDEINQRLIRYGALVFGAIVFLTFWLSNLISKPLEALTVEIQNILNFKNEERAPIKSKIYEINTLSTAIKRLKSTISAFAAYVPKDLVSDLLSSEKDIEVGGESRYLTILFSDLQNFSSLSEITPSRELLLRVSSYLQLMTTAIKEEFGTVDKFIGDSVMAFWGAPLLNQNHAYHACVAAIKAQRRMIPLNNELIASNHPPLTVRIGIHCDAVLVGNIGSAERLSYTVMGDGVNLASRLEGINKEFGTKICVSHSIFKEAGERLWLRPIDQIFVRGRKSGVVIYELVGIRDGDMETSASEIEKELCALTSEAFKFYSEGNFDFSKRLYTIIAEKFNDELSAVMTKKSEKMLSSQSHPNS
jgi:adenylate cyclase